MEKSSYSYISYIIKPNVSDYYIDAFRVELQDIISNK